MAGHDNAAEIVRGKTTGPEVRFRAIKTQLSTGSTLCALAEMDIDNRRIESAHRVLGRVRHTVESVRRRLDDPNYVSPYRLPEVRDQREQLEQQVLAIQARLERLF